MVFLQPFASMSLGMSPPSAGPKLNATEKDALNWKTIATRFFVLGFVLGVVAKVCGVWRKGVSRRRAIIDVM